MLEFFRNIFFTLIKLFAWICNKMRTKTTTTTVPISVNYHLTRVCNYSCGFCFHTAKTSYNLPIEQAKHGMEMLVKAGMQKINFSGGEPFIVQGGKYLGELVKFCKEDLDMKSVTVVTNGSKVTQDWMREYGYYLDIMAVSCDSFDEEVNKKIGRYAKGKKHLETLRLVRQWCEEYGVLFKVNTVVNTYNVNDNMVDEINELNPIRWKVFQCLPIFAENIGQGALRQVDPFLISDQQFAQFLKRHSMVKCLVPESNEAMRNSYLILDEYMRFLDNTGGAKTPSPSLLDVGVANALDRSGFDEAMFFKRGGKYTWSKQDAKYE